MRQLELRLRAPYRRRSETSRAAAESIEPVGCGLRARVLNALRAWGPMTDSELQERLEMDPSTQRPRRVELVRMGLVRDSGARRPTSSGRAATVWEVVT
jgi:hypothetical protein